MPRRPVLAAALLAALVAPAFPSRLAAQKAIPRPALDASADTNDSKAYYDAGVAALPKDPKRAADAFHWAIRLDPWNGDAFYGRRIALLLSDKRLLLDYWSGDRRTLASERVKQIDSLMAVALSRNPFMYQRLEGMYFDQVLEQIAQRATANSDVSAGLVRYEIDGYLRDAGPAMRGYRAYTDGNFPEALKLYAQAVKQERKERSPGLRINRANLFAQLGQVDSAIAEFSTAIEALRAKDKRAVVYFYQSKALLEHSIGLLHQRAGRNIMAREAYARALEEDLGYAPAHVQLAMLAMEQNDAEAAMNEIALAAQISANDATIHHLYGVWLMQGGRSKEAEEQLRKAITMEPWFAGPHVALAEALLDQGRNEDALRELELFLATSPKRDARRQDAVAQVAALRQALGK